MTTNTENTTAPTTTDPTADPTAAGTDPAPLAPDDPRRLFAAAVARGGEVVAGVRPDQLELPTPCDDFDVRGLLGHLTGVLRKVAMIGRGESPFLAPQVLDGIADDGWPAAWLDAAHEVQAVWRDDALLDRIVQVPWAQLPGRIALAMYTSEITVHTWDLATAVGQTPAWDDEVVAVSLEAMQIGLPAEGRAESFEAVRAEWPADRPAFTVPFGAAVEVPADAPLIERLVAWTGRKP